MSEENNTNENDQAEAKPDTELNESELDNVSGGAVDMFRKRLAAPPEIGLAGPPDLGLAAPPEKH
jgi:bacteriocin-like protein